MTSRTRKPHVEIVGSGPNLVLLHGWGLHGGIWAPVRDALAARFRLHIVDLPGHGHSRDVRFTALDDLAHQVSAVLPRDYALCGWSMGGLVSMALALNGVAPRKLVLIATTPRFVRDIDWDHAMAPDVLADFAARLAGDYRKTLMNFLSLQALNDSAARRTLHALRDTLFARGEPHPDVLSTGLDVLKTTDLRARLHELATPTLVIHGDRDALTPQGAGAWLADTLPDARWLPLDQCAHVPFLSHPETFTRAVIDFLDAP